MDENLNAGQGQSAQTSEPAIGNGAAENAQGRNEARPGSAAARIQELSQRAKYLESQLAQALNLNEKALSAFNTVAQPRNNAPRGTFEEFSDEQIEAGYADSLNKDSDNYNPQKSALYLRELRKRDRESVKSELMGKVQVSNDLATAHNQAYTDAVMALGDDAAEFENPSSPLKLLAVREWNALVQEFGNEAVQSNPKFQKFAVKNAFAKWKASQVPAASRVPDARSRARESLSSGMEAEVDRATSQKSHFARGEWRQGLMQSPLIQSMVEDVTGNQSPNRRN